MYSRLLKQANSLWKKNETYSQSGATLTSIDN